MTEPGLIVVGSGPAGVSAAAAFREADQQAPILLLTADQDLPYERPPPSKDYLRGQTDGGTPDVTLNPPQWYDDHKIQLLRQTAVDLVDVTEHGVVAGGSAARLLRPGDRHRCRTVGVAGARRRARPPAAVARDATRLRDSAVGASSVELGESLIMAGKPAPVPMS